MHHPDDQNSIPGGVIVIAPLHQLFVRLNRCPFRSAAALLAAFPMCLCVTRTSTNLARTTMRPKADDLAYVPACDTTRSEANVVLLQLSFRGTAGEEGPCGRYNHKMRISYDGSRYFGYQLQRGKPDQPSIQQVCMAVAVLFTTKFGSLHQISSLGLPHRGLGCWVTSVILCCSFGVLQTEKLSCKCGAVMILLPAFQDAPRSTCVENVCFCPAARFISIAAVQVGEGVKRSEVRCGEHSADMQKWGAGVGESAVHCLERRP